jgi:Tol biopolymer transport system component
VTGTLRRLTDDAAVDRRPSISRDGKKLLFLPDRVGSKDVWMKDLATGKDTNLTATPLPEIRVRVSADGSNVFYNQRVSGRQPPILVVGSRGGVSKNVCTDCGILLGVSADGNKIIYWGETTLHLFLLDVETGQKTEIIPSTAYSKYRPLFSPDGRWLTFTASVGANPRKVYVAPLRAQTEGNWIAVTDALSGVNEPDWSPDGNLIYFLSSQDGLQCIWAQRLDPSTKRPVGSPFEIHHFSSSRRSLTTFMMEISVFQWPATSWYSAWASEPATSG